jgi:polar amino acid transport system substrate-binding protein
VLKNKILTINNTLRLLCLGLFILGCTVTNLSQANTLKVCYDQWAPMTIFPSQDAPERGVVIDMLEQIYSAEGYQLEYFEVPLARGLNMVAEGLCDILPEYLYSKEAELEFEFASEATFVYSSAFVVRRNDPWRYDGIQSVRGKRIATGPGWNYSSMSADYQEYIDEPDNTHFVEVIAGYDDVVDRIFRMIKENRVDLYADNELVLQHVLNRLNLNDDLIIVRPGLEKELIELPIFSKKIPASKRQKLIKIWDQGRVSMQGKQEQKLLEKYQVTFDK